MLDSVLFQHLQMELQRLITLGEYFYQEKTCSLNTRASCFFPLSLYYFIRNLAIGIGIQNFPEGKLSLKFENEFCFS